MSDKTGNNPVGFGWSEFGQFRDFVTVKADGKGRDDIIGVVGQNVV